jgi:hypothetical protein
MYLASLVFLLAACGPLASAAPSSVTRVVTTSGKLVGVDDGAGGSSQGHPLRAF